MIELRDANLENAYEEWVFVKNIPENENGFTNTWHGCTWEEYCEQVLPEMISWSKGENLPEGYVPETFFFLWVDGRIAGQFRIRHYLNDSLRTGAGHIGYYIAKPYRCRGYASEGLRLALDKARSIVPDAEIFLRVNRDNPASLRVMQKNGGRIVSADAEHFYVRIANAGRDSVEMSLSANINFFLSSDIPETGPGEQTEMDPPVYECSEEETPADYPGGGLHRYSMLYIGEGDNTIYLVHDGKVAWRYRTGKGWELDDIWMLKNGNILFSHMYWVGCVTPGKELMWRWDCPPGTEVHTLQPTAENEAVILVNGTPPKLLKIRIPSGRILWEKEIPCRPDISVHGQFRRMRITKDGTFLIAHLSENRVSEYDQDMHEIWRYPVKGPWAAERLDNGNTLITAEVEERTIEIDPSGKLVWQIRYEELPEPYRIAGSQSCVRLANGNTILCSRGDGGKRPQLVEVTQEKKVVWCIRDFKNLGPATSIQILGQGIRRQTGNGEDPIS